MIETKEEQAIEFARIGKSVFSFLRHVKIQEPGDLELDYTLWEHLRDFYNNLLCCNLIDMIKAKQVGISWALAIWALYKIYTKDSFPVLEISKGETESHALLQKSKVVYRNLPKWMQIYTLYPDTTEKFGFKENGSIIEAFPSTETSGIGKTAGLVIHDESDFHPYYEINLSHTRATVADSSERQLVSVSTVDKMKPNSYFKRHFRESQANRNGFKALFYPYNVRPNRDDAFYQSMVRENEATPWVVEGNYPRTIDEALSPQSATSCFNKDVLLDLWNNCKEPIETRQGFIHIYSRPRVGVTYSAGVDVGEGVGLDYSSLDIVGKDGINSEVVAKIYTNTLATDLFAYEIHKLCGEYFNPLLAVENNAIGVAVINKLVELGYTNLFSSEADNKKKTHRELSGSEKKGWTTGEKNKQTGVVELIEIVNSGGLITKFKPQIQEMMEFQWVNGKPEATGATHGDTVISLMLAHQMLKRSHSVVKGSISIKGRRVV